jgi:hypothetical protein
MRDKKNARKLDAAGFNKLALKVAVKEMGGASVSNADALLLVGAASRLATSKPLAKKKTTVKGQFQVTSIPSGSYVLQVKKAGYKPAELVVNITDGETSVVEVVLERE